MPIKLSSPQAGFQAIAALARWLPHAPTAAPAVAACIPALLAAELPGLRLSLALEQQGAWLLHGETSQAAQAWLAHQAVQPLPPVASASASRPAQEQPVHSTVLEPAGELRVALAIWSKAFSPDAFAALAAQIALAFTSLRCTRPGATRSSTRELQALQHVAGELNATLDLDRVFAAVLAEACATTGALYGGIALRQNDDEFRYVQATGPDERGAESLLQGGLSQSARAAVEQNKPIVVLPLEQAAGSPEAHVATIDVPIHYGEQVVGLLTLHSPPATTGVADHLPFIRLLADQAAIAIGNAEHAAEHLRQRELLQQRASVLNEVLEVGHLLRADRALADMLNDIAYGIVNAVGFRSVIINLRDEANPACFVPLAFAGVLPHDVDRLRSEGLSAELVDQLCAAQWRLSSSYLVPASAVDGVAARKLDQLTTPSVPDQHGSSGWQAGDLFITPLKDAAGTLIGLISVAEPFDRRRPTRRSAEAIEIFANQATIAIENVRLYNDSQCRLTEQNALNRIQQSISASLDVRDMLRAVYVGLASALEIDSYYSLIYDQDNPDIGVAVSVDEGEWYIEQISGLYQYRGLHAYLMHTRQPLCFNDLRIEQINLPAEFRVVAFGDNSKRSASWMGVPLIAHDNELIGALSVHSYTSHRFGRKELAFLQAVTHQVAISFQNARLFAERERRLHEVHVVNQLAQALAAPISPEELADVLYTQLHQALHTSSVLLAVHDRKNDLLEFPLVVDQGQRCHIAPMPGGQGVVEHMLRTRQPLLLNDDITAQLKLLNIEDADEGARSFVGTPLLVGNEAVGVIVIRDYERNNAFGQHELTFLQALALQVASGIEKARLLQEREREINQMHTLNNIGKVSSSTLDLHALFTAMYTELIRYRKIDILMVSVCEPATHTLLQMLTVDNGELQQVDGPRPIPPHSYTDVVMRTGAPLLLRDARTEKALHEIAPVVHGQGVEALSLVCVPLLNTSGQRFGVLSMQSYAASQYDLRDIDFLSNVAHQIALNIQNAALFRQSQEQVKQLASEMERMELINRVSSWAGELLDVQELLQRTVNEMARVTKADQVRLLLLDRARDIGICQAELHDTGSVGRLVVQLTGNPAIEWFDQHRTSLLIPNAVHDPRFAAVHHVWRAENIRDVLIVPLIVNGEIIGSIGLDAQAREETFAARDVATCETIANQVAVAIENARLWQATQQSVRELTTLYDISLKLTTMVDLDAILATLASAAVELEQADLGAIVLLDTAQRVSRFAGRTRCGEQVDPTPFSTNPYILELMHEPKPLVVSGFGDGSRNAWLELAEPMHSGIMVPIVVKSQPVGVLMIAAGEARVWSEREQSLLSILGGQAASAIENASLFTSEQEKRQLADTLREVGLALTSTLDLREVLEMILVQLRRVVPYDSTSMQLLRDDNQLQIIAGCGFDDMRSFDNISFPADSPDHPNHWVIETQRPLIVSNTRVEYPGFYVGPQSDHIRSWMGVPLVYGNQVLGMIALDSRELNFYTDAMADVALMFATQAAQAIAQARLFDQIRQFNVELEHKVADRTAALTAEKERLEAVHAITTTLTASLDIDEIVLKTLELVAGVIGARRGSLLIRDPMREALIYRAVLTEPEGVIATDKPFDLPPGNMVQWTMEHEQGVVIADVCNDERWLNTGPQSNHIRSFIAVPLLAADVPLGVLMLNHSEPGFFNEGHLRLLSTIASEVAIAVHNAELYNFINEQATRLAELLQAQREETGKNRAILESVAEGVLVLDEQDTIVLFNQAASQVLQIADTIIVGQSLRRMAEHGDAAGQMRVLPLYTALVEGIAGARQHSDPINRLLELPGQTIDLTFTPVTTPDGDRLGVAVVLRDITREIESDKAKREFIATVSHELRTPLTSVKGYIDLLLLGTAGPISEMQQSFLQVVKSNADRLNGLVEDLLEISRLENGKLTLNIKPLHIRDLINDIAALLRTETERKRMQLVLEIEPTLPLIEADGKRISQVLTNLLSNAHKYTRDGGEITVRVYRRDALIQVDVSDTGVGIPPDELSKMFSRFFRSNNSLKDEVGGTGLGLSIAKSFVELHGGTMWVTSELNVGSTFSFTLPIQYRPPLADGVSHALSEVVDAA